MSLPVPPQPAARRTRLTVLAGPTAVGKGSVSADIRAHHPEIWISVSATTRAPRPGEEHGVHYWFLSEAEFDALVEQDALLEWAVVHGAARYGTPRAPVEEMLAAGRPALLEIDLQGARQVRERMPEALFCLPGAALVGGAGTPPRRPRHRERGGARAPARQRPAGAGRRAGVRRGHREPRNSRCRGGVGSLDDWALLAHPPLTTCEASACLHPPPPPRA